MLEGDIPLYNSIDKEKICNVKGIIFTNREIDVIACIICGKTTKIIAHLLSIYDKNLSVRSVETHIYNIRRKIGAASKGSIIEFIEKSGKYELFHKRYFDISLEKELDHCLSQIKSYKTRSKLFLQIDSNCAQSNFIAQSLERFFKNISFKSVFNYSSLANNTNDTKRITITVENNNEESDVKYPYVTISLEPTGKLLIQVDSESKGLNQQSQYNFSKKEDIYLIFLSILKIYYPAALSVIEHFEKSMQQICSIESYGSIVDKNNDNSIVSAEIPSDQGLRYSYKNLRPIISTIIQPYVFYFISLLFVSIVLASVYVLFYVQPSKPSTTETVSIINYLLPDKDVLLERDELNQEIKNKLQSSDTISAVTLIGDRGAGKTTLARSFAYHQKSPLIWEINAETEESIKYSFTKLANIIAASKNDIETLQYLKTINMSHGNEEKLIKYVSDHLYQVQNWILIFDNLESFDAVKKYYPNNSNIWGKGKILITTCNNNLKNNLFIRNAINVGFLSESSALTLFNKIIQKAEPSQKLEIENVKAFLSSIPPFPLDIVIAANYVTATHSSLEEYLTNLNNQDKNFHKIQAEILKEASNYDNTRVNIISLAVDKILNTDLNFVEPFVLISMVDSTNIPKTLLNHIQNDTFTNDFIYNLKKHSLISEEKAANGVYTFSIHRAIQSSILSHLKKTISPDKLDKILVNIANILQNSISSVVDSDDMQDLRGLLTHSINFLHHEKILPLKAQCLIGSALGPIYHALGYYNNEVLLQLEKHLMCLEELGEYRNVAVNSKISLAHMYRVTGLYKKAEEIYRKTIDDYSAIRGQAEGLMVIECCLGDIYAKLGQYKKAAHYFNDTILADHQDKNAHPRCFTNLGIYYADIGEYNKAVKTLEKAIAILTQNHSLENPKAAWGYIGLGRAYNMVGNDDKALTAVNHGVKLLKEYFPKDDISLAWANIVFGRINTNTKNYDLADHYFQQAYEVYNTIYGPEHVLTSALLNSMAYLYLQIKDFKKCEEFANRALSNYTKISHPLAFRSLEILGELYLAKIDTVNDKAEIEQYKLQALNSWNKALDTVNYNFPATSEYATRVGNKLKKLQQSS